MTGSAAYLSEQMNKSGTIYFPEYFFQKYFLFQKYVKHPAQVIYRLVVHLPPRPPCATFPYPHVFWETVVEKGRRYDAPSDELYMLAKIRPNRSSRLGVADMGSGGCENVVMWIAPSQGQISKKIIKQLTFETYFCIC